MNIEEKIIKMREEAQLRAQNVREMAQERSQHLFKNLGRHIERKPRMIIDGEAEEATVSNDMNPCESVHEIIVEQRRQHKVDLLEAINEAVEGLIGYTDKQKEKLIKWYMEGSERKTPVELVKARAKVFKRKK